MKLYVNAARVPKKITEYVVQGDYGYGWDDLTYHDTYQAAKDEAKTYRENENVPIRVIERKVDNPQYNPANDPMYGNLSKKFKGIKNIIGNDNLLIRRRRYLIESDVFDEIGGVETVIYNPRKLENYSYAVESLGEKDLEWQDYLDDVREAIRSKYDITATNGTFGEVPTAIAFNSITKYSRKPAVHITVYDV